MPFTMLERVVVSVVLAIATAIALGFAFPAP